MNKQKIIILDFETGDVHVFSYDQNIWDNPEDFITELDIYVSLSNCQWMVVDILNIQIHE